MEYRHLRYFVTVAEELNFSRAARKLHVSQPPLSRQIRDLEGELGLSLFRRGKIKIELTEAGRDLFQRAQVLLREREGFLRRARELAQAERPELHIGYVAHVHAQLIIDSATRFRLLHPDVAVKVFDSSTTDQIEALLAGRMHLGFVGFQEAAVRHGLEVECIGTTHAIVALPENHPFARRPAQPLSAFKDEPFIAIDEKAFPGAREYMLEFCRLAGFQPRIVHQAVLPVDLLNQVALGEGVALVPEHMRDTPNPGVAFCDLREPVPRIGSYVAWKAAEVSDLVPDFVSVVKATYQSARRSRRKLGTKRLTSRD